MTSAEIRNTFLEFFRDRRHHIVPSAPIVVKNDPTLMFTNAGMNCFKDYFLGNAKPPHKRIANTQKCLRVSGKHNDLEDVGIDTYHHTMFEMLGNWSFGDYFKEEAIRWAWELLVDVYGIDREKLYVTVFQGDASEKLPPDEEAYEIWKTLIPEDRILKFGKKDNFWEMGDTGPCGFCSEIHIDTRSAGERKKCEGKTLVNKGIPEVVELWNLVFIEFNRLAGGTLTRLPMKHVDTGMGLERLCRVLQKKKSNYDTDVFHPLIECLAHISGMEYGKDKKTDVAFRVVADHLRAVAFAIADGQLPFRDGAGYVVRRILRRAVRYGYSYLNRKEPFVHSLVPVLAKQAGGQFTEISRQQELIRRVVMQEEEAFLRTLESGIKKLKNLSGAIDGRFAFELFDTYGFPIDLTQLIAREQGVSVDMDGFYRELEKQKIRARSATAIETEDWTDLNGNHQSEFIGYDRLDAAVKIIRYRKVKSKGREQYQVVFDKTPFYAEGGGQVGDTGFIEAGGEKIAVNDTQKENTLIVHFIDQMPRSIKPTRTGEKRTPEPCRAIVDAQKRRLIASNHSATHLLHAALRAVLGNHVEQKGSLVHPDYLRFDFVHFRKVTEAELDAIGKMVNAKILENIPVEIKHLPVEEARKMGAMALFGEKYGEVARVVIFDRHFSIELCGGVHVKTTGELGIFRIVNETAIAAGIRRIEAITSDTARTWGECLRHDAKDILDRIEKAKVCAAPLTGLINQDDEPGDESRINSAMLVAETALSEINALGIRERLKKINEILKEVDDPSSLSNSVQEFHDLTRDAGNRLETLRKRKIITTANRLSGRVRESGGIHRLIEKVELDPASLKDVAFRLKEQVDRLFLVLGNGYKGSVGLTVIISEDLVREKKLNAAEIVRELAVEINGKGGGQAFYASAGGENLKGLDKALEKADMMFRELIKKR